MHTFVVAVLLAAALVLAPQLASADDFVGVGGFVTAAPAFAAALEAQGLSKPDLSVVVVDLLTPNGVKKAQGECVPSGYWFSPAQQGAFTVRPRGPPGWVFEPAAAQVTCTSQGCNNEEDVNFQLVGLALSGRVETDAAAPSCAAPAATAGSTDGVSVALLHKGAKPGEKPIATATAKGGSYSFADVLPGEYQLQASYTGWALEPRHMAVTVGLEASAAPGPFRVAGFRVSGTVTSKAGPVSGIRVTLHSSDISSAACSGDGDSTAAAHSKPHSKHGSALCAATTDDAGVFEFMGVPCGRYGLVAVHPDPASTFEISPSEAEVTVGHGDAKIAAPFRITGFSVEGKVVDGAGKGVEGAKVTTDGRNSALTDANGRYVLARMQEGKCSVSAAKEGYHFEAQRGVEVSPVVKALPDFVAAKVAVCGSVTMSDARFTAKRRVTAQSTSSGSSSAEETVPVDNDGAFCVLLGPGSYRVAPIVAADEKAKGLVFSPGHVEVEVDSVPLHGVAFSQGELSVSGSIQCLESPCAAGVTLTLTAQTAGGHGAGGARPRTVRLSEVAQQEQTQAGFTKFRLPGVVPGSYKLSASKPGWCWQQDHTTVTLSSRDVEAAPLSQEGHELSVVLSRDALLAITGPDGRTFVQEVPAGRAAICLPGSGEFVIEPRSCHVFGRERLSVVTSALPQPLTLTATKALIKGSIQVTASDAPDSISLAVTPLTSGTEPFTVTATQAEDGSSHYSYSVALDVGDSLRLEPSAPGLLLYPASRTVEHTAQGRGCQPDVGVFMARPGLHLSGRTDSPVEGAEVTARFKTPSKAGNIGAAGETAASGTTDADGTFRVGPLYDDALYTVELTKPGTEFTQKSGAPKYVFSTKKLAQVRVSVVLPGGGSSGPAFVSLSGERGFKSNAKLGDQGEHTFYGLRPGTYYLRPLLREYQFEPALAEVSLTEGQDATVAFTAKRVAWCITGSLTSVNGNALAGAVVEAVSGPGDGSVTPESGVTDADGRYRIQGLAPGSEYQVTVRLDGRVTTAWPPARSVLLSRADAEDVNFVAFRSGARASLSGALGLPPALAAAGDSGVRLELRSAEGSGGETRAGRVDGAGFFEIGDVKPGAYVLRVSCTSGGCSGWERTVAVGSRDVDLGVLAVPGVAARSGGGVVGGGHEEGKSWWPQVLGLVLLLALGVLQKDAVMDMLQLDTAGWHTTITSGAAGTEPAADTASEWLKDSQSLKESQSIKRRLPAAGRRA